MEKLSVDRVLAKNSVKRVAQETAAERIARLFLVDINRIAALLTITIGLLGTMLVMLFIDSLRTTAFQLFSTIVSSALGFFFGSKVSDAQ